MVKARTPTVRDLWNTARSILSGNDRGRFIAPGPHQYPGQWNWDAALISIGLAHADPQRARHEIRQLLRGQWDDGLVPHIVFWGDAAGYFPGPDVWKTASLPGSPDVAVTGLTQPPVLASAVRILHERDPYVDFLEQVVPAIERWHVWLDEMRRPSRGLVAIFHPWESGTDNSPRFDKPLRQVPTDHATVLRRADTHHVPAEQRPTTDDYHRYLVLLETLRSEGYRPDPNTPPFIYGDVGFTSILAQAEEDLIWLWAELGEVGTEAMSRHESLCEGLGRAWDDTAHAFLDRDLITETRIAESADCSSTLMPLYAGVVDTDQSAYLSEGLWDENRFGPSSSHPWAMTSVAKTHPRFDSLRYWRGPVWVNMNWFLIRGMQRCGRADVAEELRRHTLDLVSQHGMYEYYSPETGRGLGSPDFSWTAALTLDLLERP